MELTQEAHEIKLRIAQLSELSGTDLKAEMDDLKMVLLKNPAACELLLPEDIGMAVAAIKRLVGTAIAAATKETPSSRRKGSTKVDLSIDLRSIFLWTDQYVSYSILLSSIAAGYLDSNRKLPTVTYRLNLSLHWHRTYLRRNGR